MCLKAGDVKCTLAFAQNEIDIYLWVCVGLCSRVAVIFME